MSEHGPKPGPAVPQGSPGITPKIITNIENNPVLKAARARLGVPEPWNILPIELSAAGVEALNAPSEELMGTGVSGGRKPVPGSPRIIELMAPSIYSAILSYPSRPLSGLAKELHDAMSPLYDTLADVSEFSKEAGFMMGKIDTPVSIMRSLRKRGSAIVTIMALRKTRFMTKLVSELSYVKMAPMSTVNLIAPLFDIPFSSRITFGDSIIMSDYPDATAKFPANLNWSQPTALKTIAPMAYLMECFLKDSWTIFVGMRGYEGMRAVVYTNANPGNGDSYMGVKKQDLGYIIKPRPRNKEDDKINTEAVKARVEALSFLKL